MLRLVKRAAAMIVRPESEWTVIARERNAWTMCWSYLAPLMLIAPLAYGASVLLGGEGALRTFATFDARLRFALLAACGIVVASLLSIIALAAMTSLLAPFFAGRRSFGDALRLVVYAGTPLWLSGFVLLAPLNRFPLLVIIILIATMHSAFLLYLGVNHVLRVPRRDAAECTAIVLAAGVMLSTVAGYYAGAAGLFQYM